MSKERKKCNFANFTIGHQSLTSYSTKQTYNKWMLKLNHVKHELTCEWNKMKNARH